MTLTIRIAKNDKHAEKRDDGDSDTSNDGDGHDTSDRAVANEVLMMPAMTIMMR